MKTDKKMVNSIESVLLALLQEMPPGPFIVEYDNDTGPNDEGFWEWWEVAGIKFKTEKLATVFCAVLNEAHDIKITKIG